MQRFTVLDSWRGLSACVIALLHLSLLANWSFHDAHMVENAFVVVDFFFVLSGFIICGTYEDRLANGSSPTTYMILRIGRLYPLHVATLAAVLAMRLVFGAFPLDEFSLANVFDDGAYSLSSFVANVFLVQSFIGVETGPAWNGPSWSISAEFYTYILFAGIWTFFAAAAPSRLARHVIHGSVFGLCFAYLLVSPLGMYRDYDLGIVRCIYGFSAGVLVRHLYTSVENQMAKARLGSGATAIELALVAVAIGFVGLAHDRAIVLFAPAVFALMVLVFAFERGAVSRVLRHPALLALGTLSYSIYMVHYVILLFEERVVWFLEAKLGWALSATPEHSPIPLWGTSELLGNVFVAANMVVFVAVAALTYRFIETPGRDWVRRLARRREQRRACAREAAAAKAPPRSL